jgi:glycosyltransferase involved in cell wall biosynthesis
MEIIAYTAIAYLVVQLMVAFTNLLSAPFLLHGISKSKKRVSVLIPARNEEGNIGRLLDDLTASGYENCEILVYDDDSSDSTAQIIQEKSLNDQRIRYIRGVQLPEGWLGKNHACHQLALSSKGDFLLFLDADVSLSPDLIHDALSLMEHDNPALLSIFPVQEMKSPGEWLTVPLMNRILLGNLPLLLVRKSRMEAFSAANGQFMMFDSAIYKKHRFHEMFKDEKVEDIRIIRHMKRLGYQVQTLLSDRQLSCRMYSGFGEAVNGFAKNIHSFFGRNWLVLFVYVSLTTLGPFAVWKIFSFAGLVIYLSTAILIRIIISCLSRQSWWLNTILMPFQQVAVVIISLVAAFRHFSGNLSWKGRRI